MEEEQKTGLKTTNQITCDLQVEPSTSMEIDNTASFKEESSSLFDLVGATEAAIEMEIVADENRPKQSNLNEAAMSPNQSIKPDPSLSSIRDDNISKVDTVKPKTEINKIADLAPLSLSEFTEMYTRVAADCNFSGRDLRKYKSQTAEVYGEALPEMVDHMRTSLNIQASDVFYDIGSGIGNVVFQLACQVGCKCYGVEIRPDLHDIAVRINEGLRLEMEKMGRKMGEVQLVCGNALDEPTILFESSIVYLNNVCFPESLQQQLEQLFCECLTHNSRVVAVKEFFPRMRPNGERFTKSFATLFKYPCQKYETPPNSVSWKATGVTYHIYTVDRVSWESFQSAKNSSSSLGVGKRRRKNASSNISQKNSNADIDSTQDTNSSQNSNLPSSSNTPNISTDDIRRNASRMTLKNNNDLQTSIQQIINSQNPDSKKIAEFWMNRHESISNSLAIMSHFGKTYLEDHTLIVKLIFEEQHEKFPILDFQTGCIYDTVVITLDTYKYFTSRNPIYGSKDYYDIEMQFSGNDERFSISQVDRQLKPNIRELARKIKTIRESKSNELLALNISARAIDADFQHKFLKIKSLRDQLNALEKEFQTVSESRHKAMVRLDELVQGETIGTLNSIFKNDVYDIPVREYVESSKQFLKQHHITIPHRLRLSNQAREEKEAQKRNAGQKTRKHEKALNIDEHDVHSVKDNLNDTDMNNMDKMDVSEDMEDYSTREGQFEMSNSNQSQKDSSTTPHFKRKSWTRSYRSSAVIQPRSSDSILVSDDQNEAKMDISPTSSIAHPATAALSNLSSNVSSPGSVIILDQYDAEQQLYSPSGRPKRTVTAQDPSKATSTSKRGRRPGTKSVHRTRFISLLTKVLKNSVDGKASVLEFRTIFQKEPQFQMFAEKQLERKIWDALSQARDQFIHYLPTPAERKLHMMGAGKAGLWALHPEWKKQQALRIVAGKVLEDQDDQQTEDADNRQQYADQDDQSVEEMIREDEAFDELINLRSSNTTTPRITSSTPRSDMIDNMNQIRNDQEKKEPEAIETGKKRGKKRKRNEPDSQSQIDGDDDNDEEYVGNWKRKPYKKRATKSNTTPNLIDLDNDAKEFELAAVASMLARLPNEPI